MPSKTGQSEYYMKYGSSRGKSVPEKKCILDQKGSNVKMPTSTITGYQSVYHVSGRIFRLTLPKNHLTQRLSPPRRNTRDLMPLLSTKVAITGTMGSSRHLPPLQPRELR